MKRITVLFSIIFILGSLQTPTAAAREYWCNRLSPSDGFPAFVTSISFTEYGTALLTSYTGAYTIKSQGQVFHQTSASAYPFPLPSDEVLCGITDLRDNVWILTSSGAVALTIQNGRGPVNKLVDLSDITASGIIATESSVWLGGTNKLWKYDYDSSELTPVNFVTEVPFCITEIVEDISGRLLLFSRTDSRMMILNPSDCSVTPSDLDCHGGTFTAYVDSYYRLWVSRAKGLDCYDHNLKYLFTFSRDNGNLKSDCVTCLLEKQGSVWAGTDGGGVERLHPASLTSTAIDFSDGMPSSRITCMSEDRCGNVWIGSAGQGAFVVSLKKVVPIGSDGINSLCYDPAADAVWTACMNSGLLEYQSGATLRKTVPGTEDLSIHSTVFIRPFVIFATNTEGVMRYDTRNGEISDLPGLPESCRFADYHHGGINLSLHPNGNVIVAADSLYICNPLTGLQESNPLPEGCLAGSFSEVVGSAGAWFVDSHSLYCWDETSPNRISRVLELADKGTVRSATLCSLGQIWMAIGSSIGCYDTTSDSFSIADCTLDDIPMSVLCDRRDRIWVGTKSSLHAYFPKTGRLASLGSETGVPDNYYLPLSRLALPDGSVLMGGCEGAVLIKSDITFDPQDDLSLVLDEFTVDGKSVTSYDRIRVPNRYSIVHIGFHAVAPDILRTRTYRYHISGRKINREFTSTIPYLNYYSLPSGSYTISGSCSLSDGGWSEMKELVTFHILAPWYTSWWFFGILALLAALAAVYLQYNYIVRRRLMAEEDANNERYNFFVNISHELRTPLTLVMGQVNRLIQKPGLSEADKNTLKKVYRQSEKMKTLLNTVLTSSKIKAGTTAIKLSDVDINAWLASGVDPFRDEAAGHKMNLLLRTDPDAGMVKMDDQLCQIVLSNIIMNAIRHNVENLPIIIKTERIASRKVVRVSVRDHGSGIASEDVSKVFERFYRESEEKTGFGIGLSYSKAIMDAHGGRIGADNNSDDDGATFWFELDCSNAPLSPAPTLPSAPVQTETVSAYAAVKSNAVGTQLAPHMFDFSSVSLLFVDDDAELRQYVDDELGPVFGSFLLASNGRDAMSIIRSGSVDIVVADVMMTGMDGMTLCKTIKSDYALSDIPVILLTARADNESRARGLASGADRYIAKPFELTELLTVIKTLTS